MDTCHKNKHCHLVAHIVAYLQFVVRIDIDENVYTCQVPYVTCNFKLAITCFMELCQMPCMWHVQLEFNYKHQLQNWIFF